MWTPICARYEQKKHLAEAATNAVYYGIGRVPFEIPMIGWIIFSNLRFESCVISEGT